MSVTEKDCTLCKLEDIGVTAIQTSIIERDDIIVCEYHLEVLQRRSKSD